MSPSPMSRKRSTPYATAWSQARGRSSTPLVRAARAAARASMSNSLAIAAVTSSIRFVIDRSLQQTHPAPVGRACGHPPARGAHRGGVHRGSRDQRLLLPRHAEPRVEPHRPADAACERFARASPGRRSRPALPDQLRRQGAGARAPAAAGRVVVALAATSVLTRDVVTAAVDQYSGDTETAFLGSSDLADEVELVKLSPATLSLEEMSKLWGVLDMPYLLSLTYLATVVLIAADLTPTLALPVRTRSLIVAATGPPRIAAINADPVNAAIGTGTTVVVRGTGLTGPGAALRVGPALIPPAAGATAQELRVIVDADVPAGVHVAQVVHRTPAGGGGVPPAHVTATSNAVPLLVRPSVVVADIDDEDVKLTITPPLQAGQRLTIMLGRLDAAHHQ